MWIFLESIQKLAEIVINDKNQLKNELEELRSENCILKQNNDTLLQENEHITNCLNNTKAKIYNLEEKLSLAKIQEQDIRNSLHLSEVNLKKKIDLMNDELLNKQNLLDKAQTSLDSMQEDFSCVLNELKLILDNPDYYTFKSVSLKKNDKFLSHVNRILNPKNQTLALEIFLTVDNRLRIYDDKYEELEQHVKELNSKEENFYVELKELKNEMQVIKSKQQDITNTIDYRTENISLEGKLMSLEEDNKKLLSNLNLLQLEFEKVADLQEVTQKKNINLENEMGALKTDFQNSFTLLLNELGIVIDSVDLKNGLLNIIDFIDIKHKCFNNLNLFLNSNGKTVFLDVLCKLKMKLLSYETQIISRMEEFASKIKIAENKNNKLKIQIQILDRMVKKDLTCRLLELESTLKETSNFQCKACETDYDKNVSKQEIKEINKIQIDNIQKELKSIFDMFDKYPFYPFKHKTKLEGMLTLFQENKQKYPFLNQLVDENISNSLLHWCKTVDQILHLKEEERCEMVKKNEELNVTVKLLEKGNINLNSYNDFKCKSYKIKDTFLLKTDNTKNIHDNDLSKDVVTLKRLIINEILHLDKGESEDDLCSCSPEEILAKLMQSIINMENKVQEEYEHKIKEKQECLDNLNKKNKSIESWSKEIETENTKLENKIMTLTNDLKQTKSELHVLKSSNLMITRENVSLKDKLKEAHQLLATENSIIVHNLKKDLKSIQEENKLKTEEIESLRAKLLDVACKEKTCSCKFAFEFEPNFQHFKHLDSAEHVQNQKNVLDSCNDDGDESKTVSEMACSVQRLNEEKLIFQNILTSNDPKFLNNILDKLYLLKDVAQIVVNKIHELENLQCSTQLRLQDTVDIVNKDLNDFKLSLVQLYKEFVPDERVNSFFPDLLSLKQELESIGNECLKITNATNKFQDVIQLGQSFITGLKEQFICVVNEVSMKDDVIEELNKTIANEQDKNVKIRLKLQSITEEVNNLVQENTKLLQKIKLQESDQNLILSSAIFKTSVVMSTTKEKVNYLNEMFKENTNNKCYIITADETIAYFSNQCSLMKSYIERLERKVSMSAKRHKQAEKQTANIKLMLNSTQADNKDLQEQINNLNIMLIENDNIAHDSIGFFSNQCQVMIMHINRIESMFNELHNQQNHIVNERNLIKSQLSNTNNDLENANKVIKDILTLLPFNPATPRLMVNLVEQIISEHSRLKDIEQNCFKKHTAIEDTLLKQSVEIKCLNNVNENLKIDIGNFEGHIRNLRSELRNLRSQVQKRLPERNVESAAAVRSLRNCGSAEFGIQTGKKSNVFKITIIFLIKSYP